MESGSIGHKLGRVGEALKSSFCYPIPSEVALTTASKFTYKTFSNVISLSYKIITLHGIILNYYIYSDG